MVLEQVQNQNRFLPHYHFHRHNHLHHHNPHLIRRDDLNMMVEGAWNLGVTGEYLSPSSFAVDVDGTDETNKSICLRRAFGLSFNNPRFGRVSYNP